MLLLSVSLFPSSVTSIISVLVSKQLASQPEPSYSSYHPRNHSSSHNVRHLLNPLLRDLRALGCPPIGNRYHCHAARPIDLSLEAMSGVRNLQPQVIATLAQTPTSDIGLTAHFKQHQRTYKSYTAHSIVQDLGILGLRRSWGNKHTPEFGVLMLDMNGCSDTGCQGVS